MRTRLGIGMTAIAAAVMLAVAAPARADASDDFLNMVSASGFDVGDTGTDIAYTLSTATSVCTLFHYGFTAEDAQADIVYEFPHATPQQLAAFVEAAQATLCEVAYEPVHPN